MIDLSPISKRVKDLAGLEQAVDEPDISFWCDPEHYGVYEPPTPANEAMPDWYKAVPHDIDSHHKHSAKACRPFTDALTTGWVMKCHIDMMIKVRADEETIECKDGFGSDWITSESNDMQQLGEKFPFDNAVIFQMGFPWYVKTPPGYSTLVLPPLNRPDPRFRCFAGIIDTDKYPRQLNTLGIWTDTDYTGPLEIGTPMGLVLPVKRDNLGGTASISPGEDEDYVNSKRYRNLANNKHLEEGYRKELWQVKDSPTNVYEDDQY